MSSYARAFIATATLFYTQMQLRRAFHLFAFLHHVYAGLRLLMLNYGETDDNYVKMIKNHPLCYLTVWNLILQSVYFYGFPLNAILKNKMPLRDVWKQARETLFQAIIFPLGLVVSTAFWALFLYDRSLVYPELIDEFIPPHLNHLMHTSIGIFVVLEILVRPHYYSKENSNLLLLFAGSICYITVLHWTYASTGIWVYPLLYYLTWPQRILVCFFVGFILPYVYYVLGEKIAQNYWGMENQLETKGEKR